MTPVWAPPEGVEAVERAIQIEIEREAKTRRKRLGIENLRPEHQKAFDIIDMLLDGSDSPVTSLAALTYASVMLFDVIAESAPVRSKVGKAAVIDIIAQNYFEAVEQAIETYAKHEGEKP